MTGTVGYTAAALQLVVDGITPGQPPADARALIGRNITRLDRRVAELKAWIGDDLRLVVTPEFWLSGFPRAQGVAEWQSQACLAPDGLEYTALGAVAAKHRVWLAGNGYEADPAFPNLYFQTSWLVGPDGRVVLRYRRLNTLWAASPHDVWHRYLDIHGLDGVFPVVRTAIGVLAAIASEEVLFPEVARVHALRGAEVFVHSTAEYSSPLPTPKSICRAARAVENCAYLVSANAAGFRDEGGEVANAQGHSAVIDPDGRTLALGASGDTMMTYARIDLADLRRRRAAPGMANLLSRQRSDAYAHAYMTLGLTASGALETPSGTPLRERLHANQLRAIDLFYARAAALPEG